MAFPKIGRSIAAAISVSLAATPPAVAADDFGTGIGAKLLCEASQHPAACEEQISWAYEWCKSLKVGRAQDVCAIEIIVQNLGDITGEYNLTKLGVDGDCFRIGHECPVGKTSP